LTTEPNRCIIVPEVIKYGSSGAGKAILDTEEMREVSTVEAMAWRGDLPKMWDEQTLLHAKPEEVGMQEVPVSVLGD